MKLSPGFALTVIILVAITVFFGLQGPRWLHWVNSPLKVHLLSSIGQLVPLVLLFVLACVMDKRRAG